MNEPTEPDTRNTAGRPSSLHCTAETAPVPSIDRGTVLWFGGSFDPPTIAHFTLAEHARRAIGADLLAYCPAARSPFKDAGPIASGEDRVAMLRAGIADLGQPASAVSTIELDRREDNEPSFTVDTLRAVRASLPGAVALRLLIGADQVASFHRWKDAEELLRLAEPVVLLRPGGTGATDADSLLADIEPNWPEPERRRWRGRLVEAPLIDASATEARELLHKGAGDPALAKLLPASVLSRIRERRLYTP